MADSGWQGNAVLTLVIIVLAICFGWIPIVLVIALFHNGRVRIRRFLERLGWMKPSPDAEKQFPQQKKVPWVQKPPPAYPDPSAAASERRVSVRTNASLANWEPIRKWESTSTIGPLSTISPLPAKASPVSPGGSSPEGSNGSNFSRPMATRSSSVRSTASIRRPSGQTHSRRLSAQSVASNLPSDLPPVAFQINDTYYDTTPLPDRPPSIGAAYVKSSTSGSQAGASRPLSQLSMASSSRDRRRISFDVSKHSPRRDLDESLLPRPLSTGLHLTPPNRRSSLNPPPFERPAWLNTPERPAWLDRPAQPSNLDHPHAM